MEKIYIGLDISTSIVGISIFDYNKKFKDMKYVNLTKVKCFFEKSLQIKQKFLEVVEEYSNYEFIVGIEENLQAFRPGLSSAKTLMTLSRFNGVVSYISNEVFKTIPVFINVNSARKDLGIKIDRKSADSTKDQVFNWVKNDLIVENNAFNWPTKVMKSGKNKGRVKFENCCYDMSDAYVICKSLIYNLDQHVNNQ